MNKEIRRIKIENNFFLASFTMNRFIIEHLIGVMQELDMDLGSVLLWGMVAHLNCAHLAMGSQESDPKKNDKNSEMKFEMRPVKLADLVRASKIPRETVRRKLELLEARGKLARNDKGLWLLVQQGVDQTTREFTTIAIERFLDTSHIIESRLETESSS